MFIVSYGSHPRNSWMRGKYLNDPRYIARLSVLHGNRGHKHNTIQCAYGVSKVNFNWVRLLARCVVDVIQNRFTGPIGANRLPFYIQDIYEVCEYSNKPIFFRPIFAKLRIRYQYTSYSKPLLYGRKPLKTFKLYIHSTRR